MRTFGTGVFTETVNKTGRLVDIIASFFRDKIK